MGAMLIIGTMYYFFIRIHRKIEAHVPPVIIPPKGREGDVGGLQTVVAQINPMADKMTRAA